MIKYVFQILLCAIFISACDKEEGIPVVKISKGEQYTFKFDANWSTGYSWQWVNSQDTIVADTISRVYIQSSSGMEGGEGVEEWTFKGKKPGEEALRFEYVQAFNQAAQPEEIREFILKVK